MTGRSNDGDRPVGALTDRMRTDLLDRIGRTIRLMGDSFVSRQQLVHESRKNIKKLRAGLRLLADATGLDLQRLDEDCAEIARGLSDLRDCDVAIPTTRRLAEQSPDDSDAARWREFEARLCSRREELIDGGVLDPANMRLRVEQLGLVADRLPGSGIADAGRERLMTGAKQARKKARKAFARLQRDPTEDSFHRLRKRTKREFYQQHLLVRIGLRSEDRDLDRLDSLCQSLGDTQDLAVLERLAGDCGIELTPSQRRLLDEQSERLRLESVDLARDLYA